MASRKRPSAPSPPPEPTRAGKVALIGRSNVGKSTLLNATLQLPLAIVSRRPQTTRNQLLGVLRHDNAEISLLDTPGLHAARNRLGQNMNQMAQRAAQDADVVVFVTALPDKLPARLAPHPRDLQLLDSIDAEVPVILAINKIDLLADKRPLLPLIDAFAKARAFAAIVPLSALKSNGIKPLLSEIARALPEGSPQYDEDTVTTRPTRYFAAEYVREPILTATHQEVPHSVAVSIDQFIEPPGQAAVRIGATIHVEKPSQKAILIGAGGKMLKRIGIQARRRIEGLIERRVHLQLWVRVTPNWRDHPSKLSELGYDEAAAPDGDFWS